VGAPVQVMLAAGPARSTPRQRGRGAIRSMQRAGRVFRSISTGAKAENPPDRPETCCARFHRRVITLSWHGACIGFSGPKVQRCTDRRRPTLP
jgi:hypothetical protein